MDLIFEVCKMLNKCWKYYFFRLFVCLSVQYQIGIYKIYFLSLPTIVNINSGVCLFCSLMEMKKNSRKSYHLLMWMMMNFHYYNMTERTNKIILMSSSLMSPIWRGNNSFLFQILEFKFKSSRCIKRHNIPKCIYHQPW